MCKAPAARTGPHGRLLGMTTRGDQILDRSLSKVGGKGLFVKELEVALEDGRADLAVHSLKDVPMELPDGFALACVLEREDPRDALVSPRYASLDELPQGAVVGTSSLRRVVLLRALRPDLRIEPLRGNLDTRLRKLDEGQYDAIVLAAAGLKRLGLAAASAVRSSPTTMLPAAGQGALGIEVRADRADLIDAARAAGAPGRLAGHRRRARRQPRDGRQLLDAAGRACALAGRWRTCASTRPGATRTRRTLARAGARPAPWRRSPTARRPRRSARAWPRPLRAAGAR